MFQFPVWADETVLFQRPEVRSPPLVDDCHGEHTQIDWTNLNQLFWEWPLRADCRQAYIRCAFIGRGKVFSRTWHAPFISDPVDEGAALVRRMLNLCRERVDVLVDVLAFQDMCLYERYSFTGEFDGLLLANLGYWPLTVTLNRAPNRTSTGLTAGRELRWTWPSPQVSMGISGFLWEGGIMLEIKQLHIQTATYSLLYNVKHWYSHCIILWSYLCTFFSIFSCCQVRFSPLIEPEWNKTATTEAFSTVILSRLQST